MTGSSITPALGPKWREWARWPGSIASSANTWVLKYGPATSSSATRPRSGRTRRSTSSDRTGTIACGVPVLTTCGATPSRRSAGASPSARASGSRVSSGPNSGFAWVITTLTAPDSSRSRSTGSTPMLSSWVTCAAPLERSIRPSSASVNIVAIVGWPASGISVRGVKKRTRKVATSEGKTKAVSLRFISRAIACICLGGQPLGPADDGAGVARVALRGERVDHGDSVFGHWPTIPEARTGDCARKLR